MEIVRSSPIEFIRRFLTSADGEPALPHSGQEAVLTAVMNPLLKDTVIVAGRQWGKSILLSWFICWFLMRYPNRHVWIIAPTLDQARIIFNEVAGHFRRYPLNTMLAKKIVEFPFPALYTSNGSICHARGANSPQYIRGNPADLIIEDEAAFIKEGVHTNVIEPMLTVTGKKDGNGIIRISTPFGTGDFYNGAHAAELDTTGRSKYFHFTSLDNPHADVRRLHAIRDLYGESSLIWQTEYMGNLEIADLSIFPFADIKWAYEHYPYTTKEGEQEYPQSPVAGHRYVQGVDLANRSDYFVASLFDVTNPMLSHMVRHDRMQLKGYTTYKAIVRQNYHAFNSPKTLIDATSLGESVVEDLQDIGAEGFRFTGSQAKYDLVHNLVRMLNEHRITIPYDRDIIDELRYFSYEITPSKRVKMEARQGHDDIVMALALAAQLASQPYMTGFFLGVDFDGFGNPTHVKRMPRNYDPFKDEEWE